MTTPPQGQEHHDDPAGIEPDRAVSPQSHADELLIHGLLGFLHHDDSRAQARRVDRVMQAIPAVTKPARIPGRRWWRRVVPAAAALAILAALIPFLTPFQNSAGAAVQASIQAARGPGDRRYEVRASLFNEDAPADDPIAVVDTRYPGLMLLVGHAPDGHQIVVGRDAGGEWAIRRDGGIERTHPRIAWPRWASLDGESFFADSVDKWLEALADGYRLNVEENVPLPGHANTNCVHVVGMHKPRPKPGPARIEVWINPATSVLERMELSWLPPQRPADKPRGDAPMIDNRDAAPEGAPADGPPDRLEADRPPPDRLQGDRPPPRGPRPPGAPPFGPRPFRLGPNDGPDPMHRPPLRTLVIERVDPPANDATWFSPEAHRAAGTDK